MLLLRLVVRELPQREERALVAEGVRRVLPELEVFRHVCEGVLVRHALEDLRRVRHRGRMHNIVLALLLRGARHAVLLLPRPFLLVLLPFLRLRLLPAFYVLHVRVEHLPLSALPRVLHRRRRLRHRASLPARVVERLRGALGEVELVAQPRRVLAVVRPLRLLPLHLPRERGLLLVVAVLLLLRLVRREVEEVALLREVDLELVDRRVQLEALLLVREAHDVVRRLRVVCAEDHRRLLRQLLLRELQLLPRLDDDAHRVPLARAGDDALVL
mmetsp:Transcript_2838/g.6647  ORF Transcript_2838/g.6647 Transcript_2838/m.6647 type:complete len:272 (-) Transcript_2838:68-883(-)